MKTGMTVLAVSFLTAGSLFAQVHIRESASISPVENRKMIRSYVHGLSFELQLSVPAYVMLTLGEQRCRGDVLQFIDTTVYSNEKVTSFSFGFSTVGQYYIGAYLNVTDGLPAGSFKWSVFGDGLPVKSDSGYFPEQPRHTTGVFYLPLISSGVFAASYYSTFKISVGTSGGGAGWPLLQGGSASIQSTGVVDCSDNVWSPGGDSLILKIVSGSRYASFHRVDAVTGADDSLGKIVATVGDSVGMIRLSADGEEPGSAGDWVVVEAESKGLSDRDSIFLEPFYLVHFMTYYPPTIQSAGWINVWLEALDREGRDVMIPDSVRISILPDSVSRRYGSLIAGDRTGKELTKIPWSALSYGSFTYVADGEDPPGPVDVHIEIALPGQDVRPTVMVFRLLPQPAFVTVTPPSMMPGDTASITVQQRNGDGTLSDFAADKQFEIGISSGEDYGAILLADGTKGGYFSNVTQPFRFIAAAEIAGDSVRVGIRVGTEEPELGSAAPGGKGGTGAQVPRAAKGSVAPRVRPVSEANSFYWRAFGIGYAVIRGGVKIKVAAADSTMTPLGDDDNTDNPNFNNDGPDKRRKIIDWTKRDTAGVTVTVTDNDNKPVPGYPFTMSAFVRPNTGGHDHDTNRPTGKFISPAKDTVASFQGTTNGEGKATYTYICSGFGGVDSIMVKGRTERNTASTTIQVQFSGLIELTSADHYLLIGAHSQGASSLHEKNHFGTNILVDKLKELAGAAYTGANCRLRFNDMSLVDGGPFDLRNNWDTPHQSHREGISADVSSVALGADGTTVDVTEDQLTEWLAGLTRDFGYSIENEVRTARHYHLTVK